MNILLDAYFDQNFWDDLFVETILDMFSECRFYAFLEYFPEKICRWAERFPNLYQLPECDVFLEKDMFDGYLCVGGDIFPDGGDFRKRKKYTASLRRSGGTVAFLGFNLFREYGGETQRDICQIMRTADIVAPRDQETAILLRQWMPELPVKVMPDLAFASRWKEDLPREKKLLGVSVRGFGGGREETGYCAGMAELIDGYLAADAERSVLLLCLSDGSSADREAAGKIMALLKESGRVSVAVYQGDIQAYKRIMGRCGAMICTRFHALIACAVMEIPFLPVIYEVKQENFLRSIGWDGAKFYYGDLAGILPALEELLAGNGKTALGSAWAEEAAKQAAKRVEELKELIYRRRKDGRIQGYGRKEAFCEEKYYGRQQAMQVAQKNEELSKLAAEFMSAQKTISQCQNTMAQYMKAIESCNQTNGEYFRLIGELNQRVCCLEERERQRAEEVRAEFEDRSGKV